MTSQLTTQQRDADSKVLLEAPALIKRMDYNASNLPVYIGWAIPGANAGSESWQITKHTYSGNNVTLIQFADGDTEFNNVWDDRASLSFS